VAGDRTTRAELKPYRRHGIWYARGWIPIRQPNGVIARRRIERSSYSSRRADAQILCDELAKAYEQRALAVVRPLTFARAVTNYLGSGGEARFLTPALLKLIGVMQCSEIDDTTMVDLAKALYPDATPATLNRQLYTPIIAVLKQASKSKACARPDFTRPRGHDDVADMPVPRKLWFRKVLPELTPHMAAMIMFLTLHGRRPKEAMDCTPADYDPEAKRISIRTKSGDLMQVELAEPVWQAIEMYPWRRGPGLFVYTYEARRAAMRALERACERAGVEHFGMHTVGRHTFATRLLDQGYSVKHTSRAGGWANEKMVLRRYGHLERSEIGETTQNVEPATTVSAAFRIFHHRRIKPRLQLSTICQRRR